MLNLEENPSQQVKNKGQPLFDTVPPQYLFKPETIDYEVSEWTWKSWEESKQKQSSIV